MPNTYNRRPGTAGMGGQLYEIHLLMWFLLQLEKRKEKGLIDKFWLATNMMEAGDFDDVVLKYEYTENGAKKSKRIFLQAKHREAEQTKENKAKDKVITLDAMLSRNEKGDFNLRKYLSSQQKIKQLEIKDHPILDCCTDECEYVIFTNAKFKRKGCENCVQSVDTLPGDIFYFKDELEVGREYYRLTPDEGMIEALRTSIDHEKLIKELAQCLCSGSFDTNKAILCDYQYALEELVLERINKKEGKLREDFLNGEHHIEFRNSLFEAILSLKKENSLEHSLINELKESIIKMPISWAVDTNLKLSLPSAVINDVEVKEFLKQLKIFANQPNDEVLCAIIRKELTEMFNVRIQKEDVVFSIVENRLKQWWKTGNQCITESSKYFQAASVKSVWFDVTKFSQSFVGREQELKNLHEKIQRFSNHQSLTSKMTLLSGARGVGKSELARRYIQEYGYSHYDNNIIWINAECEATMADSVHRLTKELNFDPYWKERELMAVIEETYSFFGEKGRSLFIFDNVEDENCVRKFLPLKSHHETTPYVLITSQIPALLHGLETMDLKGLNETDAKYLVKKGLDVHSITPDDFIKEFIQKLQHLPLAMQQGISYIKFQRGTREYTVQNYLEEYGIKEKELQDKTLIQANNDNSELNATACLMALDKISSAKKYGKVAIEILRVIAFLSTEMIRRSMFLQLTKGNEEVLKSAVRLLAVYSIIEEDNKRGLISVSKFVQEVVRQNTWNQGDGVEIIRKSFKILTDEWREEDLRHITLLWRYASKFEKIRKEFNDLPRIMYRKLRYLDRFHEAKLYEYTILNILEDVTGEFQKYALHRAAYSDNVKEMHRILKELKNKGEDEFSTSINEKNEKGNTPLMVASELGNANAAQVLIENGADAKVRNNEGLTALHWVAEKGNHETVELLIGKAAEILFADDKFSVLHKAAAGGNEEVIRIILKKINGRSNGYQYINAKNWEGNTPLMCAASKGNTTAVKLLIDFEADASIQNYDGWTALHISAQKGHLPITKLLSNDVKLLLAKPSSDSILHSAALGGHEETVRFIIKKINDNELSKLHSCVNAVNQESKTPLVIAAESGNIGVVKALLERGADPRKTENTVRTALYSAVEKGHFDVTKLLLGRRGSEALLFPCDGVSLLHSAAKGGNEQVIDLILKKIEDDNPSKKYQYTNARTPEGETPLMYAAHFGHAKAARILLDNGADPDIKKLDGSTAMSIAVANHHLEVAELLSKDLANLLNNESSHGFFIRKASAEGDVDVMKLIFLKAGEKSKIFQLVNEMDVAGCTALMMAAKEGQTSASKLLIANEADPKVRDNLGRTALHFAAESGKFETTELMLNAVGQDALFDVEHDTVLHKAVHGGNVGVVKLILNRLIETNIERRVKIMNFTNAEGRTPLMTAAAKDQTVVAQLLIEYGAEPNKQSDSGLTALHFAAEAGSIEITEWLIHDYYNEVLHFSGETILHKAARGGHVEVIRTMERKLSNFHSLIEERNGDYMTPLMVASGNGHFLVVKLLIEFGASPTITNDCHCTALHIAAQFGHLETTEWLSNTYPNILLSLENVTVLHRSALGGHEATTLFILNRIKSNGVSAMKAHINAPCIKTGLTPLMMAAENGNLVVIKLLIEHGANPTMINNEEQKLTALHIAAKFGNLEATEWFSSNYPEILLNFDDMPVLHIAVQAGHAVVTKHILREINSRDSSTLKANIDRRNIEGWTQLMVAAKEGHTLVVKLLTEYGADPTVRNNFGRTALHIAAQFGKLETTEWLTNTYPQIALNLDFETVLHRSALGGHEAITQLILKKILSMGASAMEAHINAQSKTGWTPLMMAAEMGHLDMIKLLIEYGANPRIKNTYGDTAFGIADFCSQVEVTKWLSDAYPQ